MDGYLDFQDGQLLYIDEVLDECFDESDLIADADFVSVELSQQHTNLYLCEETINE